MLKIKAGQLIQIVSAIQTIKNDPDLNLAYKYKIGRIQAILNPEITAFNDSRQLILEKHVKKDENGKFVIENNNFVLNAPEAFANEYNPIANTEIECNIEPVILNLELLQESKAPGWVLDVLEPFLDIRDGPQLRIVEDK